MAFTAHELELDGVKLSYRRGGKGAPLLYLHGAVGLATWPDILDDLAQKFDVIAPDHPGFGGSQVPDWMDDVSDLAYFYLDFLDNLDLTGVHLVGHSLGGWIALEMAVRSQQRLADITLMASAGIHVKGHSKADIFMIDPDEQARMAFADPELGEKAAQLANEEKYEDVAITDRIASARFGWSPRFYNRRLGRWLHRIKVPAMIIWGEQDRIFPPQHGPAFQELMPGSELVMMEDCGHLPHVEKRQETLAALDAFMRR